MGLVAELSFLLSAKAAVVSDYLLEQSVSTTVQRLTYLHAHAPQKNNKYLRLTVKRPSSPFLYFNNVFVKTAGWR